MRLTDERIAEIRADGNGGNWVRRDPKEMLALLAERDELRKALQSISDEGCTSYKHHIWCPACTAYKALTGTPGDGVEDG